MNHRVAFYTVTNNRYFPGAAATLSSIRRFYPEHPIWVFPETRFPLTETQKRHLAGLANVHVVEPAALPYGGIREAWQLKAHAARFLAEAGPGVIVQVDSDAVLCGSLDGIIERVVEQDLPAGGKDGDGVFYDAKYAPYYELCGSPEELRKNAHAPYISTSIAFFPVPRLNEVLTLWSQAADEAAHWGPDNRPRKIYPGYSDQGLFNAILHFKGIVPILIENELLSEHWVHGKHAAQLIDGEFRSQGRVQYAFHSVGWAPKFWAPSYPAYVAKLGTLEEIYRYWLSLLFEGACGLLRSGELGDIRTAMAAWFPGNDCDLCAEYERRCLFASESLAV